jgi:hypothetical protein
VEEAEIRPSGSGAGKSREAGRASGCARWPVDSLRAHRPRSRTDRVVTTRIFLRMRKKEGDLAVPLDESAKAEFKN